MIDQSTVERIYDVAEITDVVGEFVTLKKRGVNFLGLCPFHNERTPSFTVSPSKGIYKCFGCGKGGNAVNFIMEHENLNYAEALRFLAKKYNIEIKEEEETPERIEQRNERESMMIVSAFAQKYFTNTLHNENDGRTIALSYLRQRGIRDDIIKKFELGYCPDKKDAFTQTAQKEGYKMDFLEKTGLTIRREDWVHDRFSARVIFPIHNIAGRVIAFGGRILKDDAKAAKYLNSPESEIYHKSHVLYGIFQAKREIVRNDKCFLVEGYTDVLAFHQAGIENVVASSGTALTPDQIRLIKRFSNNVTIIYDGDEAGIKASLRGIDLVLKEGLNIKVLLLPDGEDPDSFARSMNSSALIAYISKNETDFITFKTQLLLKGTEKDPVTRARVITDIVQSVSMIPEPIVRSVYIKECSNLLDVKEEVLYQEVRKIKQKQTQETQKKQRRDVERSKSKRQESPSVNVSNGNANPCDVEEKELLRLILRYCNHPLFEEKIDEHQAKTITVKEYIITELDTDGLESVNPDYQKIFDETRSLSINNEPDFQKHFINHNNPNICRIASDLLADKYIESQRWKRSGSYVESEEEILNVLVPKAVIEYKMTRVKLIEREVLSALKRLDPEKETDAIIELQTKIINLKKVQNILSKDLGERAIING